MTRVWMRKWDAHLFEVAYDVINCLYMAIGAPTDESFQFVYMIHLDPKAFIDLGPL